MATEMSAIRTACFDVREWGAVGDGETVCTEALQRAIDAAGEAGGGTVVVPAGTFVSGTLWMRSNVTLHLEPGATLLGVADVEAFPVWASEWEGSAEPSHAGLIAGEDLENIAITGRGTIDGGGAFWWDLHRKKSLKHFRPRLIRVVNCRNVLIEGVTLTNSPAWTVVPTACDNVTITKITIRNPNDSPNTDGINPDSCSNVHISDCHIDVGDDCITIKSGKEDDGRATLRACENITITNCTMLHGHGGVVIGSEMSGGVRNVAISNCVFVGTDRGIRLKSRRGRGNAIEDLRVSNVVMDGVFCPLVINLFYGCGAWGESKVTDRSAHPVDDGTPRMRRLRFSNISARNVKYAAGFVLGLPEMPVEDISFSDISIYLDRHNTELGAPAMAPGADGFCRAGFTITNARRVRLRNIDVHDPIGPAVSATDCHDVVISDLSATWDDEPRAAVELRNVEHHRVEGCRVPAGSRVMDE
jgi:polygalacturonase